MHKHLKCVLNVVVGQPSASIRNKDGWGTGHCTWVVAMAFGLKKKTSAPLSRS